MRKTFILLPLAAILVYLVLSSYNIGPASGGAGDRTGASGVTGCGGIGCHTSPATAGVNVAITLMDGGVPVSTGTYIPSHAYTIQVSGVNNSAFTNLDHFGFQVAAVKTSTTTSAGTFSVTGISGVAHTWTSGTVSGVEHSSPISGSPYMTGTGGIGSTYTINVPWTAPVSGTGSVTVFMALNAVHMDGSPSNDYWNNMQSTFCEAVGSITGTPTVCAGLTTILSDATSGGTWSSSNTGVATVSGGTVTGVSVGTAVISYNAGCSGIATQTVTVNATPTSIFGIPNVCVGSTTVLGDITPGGTWSSSDITKATVTSGTVSGVASGTATISYTVGSCSATLPITVNPLPTTFTGSLTVCTGQTTTLGSTPTGGTWTSGNTGIATVGSSSGIVTGVSPGTVVITYTSTSGCVRTGTVTVNATPGVITGTMTVCPGFTTTLNDATPLGTWTSSNPGVATIGSSSGLVTGVAPGGGTTVITYTVGSCSVTATVTVNPNPSGISGTTEVCPGSTTTLSDGGGGTWISANPAIATVGSGSGIVTGVATGGGTTLITYTLPVTGCFTTTTVTVDPNPPAITGTMTVCVAGTTTLADAAPGGGFWTSSAPGTASVDVSGVVTGVAAGTATITFTSGTTSCTITAVVTVNPLPGAISGSSSVCVGSTATLTDAGGGTWTSGSPGIASIGSSSGVVTGVSVGSATITYTLPVTGCTTTRVETVNPLPPAIGGTPSVCAGLTTTLSETASGTWVSNNLPVATVPAGPGTTAVVTGVSAGTAVITFTLTSTGCANNTTVTVNPRPAAISGTLSLCAGGATTTLTDGSPGGSWTSSNTAVATIGSSSGTVTTGISGTTTITYTLPTGCTKTAVLTVNPLPGSIIGPGSVCEGSSVTLSDAGGGTWTSGSPAIAVIGSSSGAVTGVSAGTTLITYTLSTGCSITRTETVNPAPGAISGPSSVCVGQTITLTDAGGGTWTSSSGTATVGSSTGIVTGVSPGTSTIRYTLPVTGCFTSMPITINALSGISGLTSLCAGTTTTLTDATPGGTWTSSNTAAATIGSSSGVVTAIAPGTTIISYTLPSGCIATSTVNVISAPSAISGPSQVCIGATITLTDAGGGTWSSSNPAIATVGSSSGIVTGVSFGTVNITYSLGTGCTVFTPVTVNTLPPAISGTGVACAGANTNLSETSSGNWSSSNTAIATVTAGPSTIGTVTGVSGGNAVITYTVPSTGCNALKTVTINALPASISGSLSVCVGASSALSDATPGGTWTSSAPGTATVGSTTGTLTGIAAGNATISYTLTSTGCRITAIATVNPLPLGITGTASACVGSGTLLSDATPGGTWASSNTAVATVGSSTGLVVGVSAGTATITYALGTGCTAIKTVTINALPVGIGGTPTVCVGATTTLTDGTPGGTWTSGNVAVATVGSTTGVVTGASAGTAGITYTLTSTGCTTTTIVTVNPLPLAISGAATVCSGSTTPLTDATPGGTWTSSNLAIATVGSSSGVVTGAAAGVVNITYTLSTGCFVTKSITVNPLPSAITGGPGVCLGSTATLTDGGGGTWTSSNTAVATIGSGTGVVTGISLGTVTITYTLSTGCLTTTPITVNPLPSGITGTAEICAGQTSTLSDVTAGGVWSSSNTGIATIGSSSGIVLGVSAGTATITYLLSTGCFATVDVTVDPLPSAIAGPGVVCVAATITLTDGGGGTWTSSSPANATIGSSSGIVTGVAAGTTTITYALSTGCLTTKPITVNPLPVAGTITGASSVCATDTIHLADAAPGGGWTSTNTTLATVNTSGVVTGLAAGVDTIKYSVANSCGTAVAVQVVTVNPQPAAGTISGATSVCVGVSITLTDAATGGTWSSSTTDATVGSATGVVTGVAAGSTTITYTVTNVCGTATTTTPITVNPQPVAGAVSGPDSVCEGETITLTDPAAGGVWSSGSASASVGSGTGIVTGVSAGTAIITYSVTNLCGTATATLNVTVRSHADCNVGVHVIPTAGGEFKVYPNPSDGSFTIEIPETSGEATIAILDVLGKEIESRTMQGTDVHRQAFNLNNIAPGSYIIRVNAGNKTYREKIVIRY